MPTIRCFDDDPEKGPPRVMTYDALDFTGCGKPMLCEIARQIAGDDGRYEVQRQPQQPPRTSHPR